MKTVDESFRVAYWRAVRELDTVRLLQWERYSLTLPQLRIIFQLQRTPGMTSVQLSRTMGITISTTSGLVAKLVDAGLVVRGRDADDRRQIPLELTDAGRAQAGELAEFAQPFVRRLAAALGDDLEFVTAALVRLAEAASQARETRRPWESGEAGGGS
jgi:DNA-binding MarR family transcriptional regulator